MILLGLSLATPPVYVPLKHALAAAGVSPAAAVVGVILLIGGGIAVYRAGVLR